MNILLMEHLFREMCNTNTNLLFETILLDESKLDTLYDKYYNSIPREEFDRIASADVVTTNMSRGRLGMYAKWLLKLYQNNNLDLNELGKAKEYLPIFDRVAKSDRITPDQKNLHKINSLSEMETIIQPFLDGEEATSKGEEVRQIKDKGAKKIYEDGRFLVIQPLTEEASCYYGSNTTWCTAATESTNMFDEYHKQGPLYIIIDKTNNEKYQFHYERNEFRYSNNNNIDFNKNTELLPILGKLSPDETIKVNVNGYWGLIDRSGNWLLEPKYYEIGELDINGYRKVMLNFKWGLIDRSGNWLLEPKYNDIYDLEADGNRRFKINGKLGLLDKNCEWLLEPKWDKIWDLEADGSRRVGLNGKVGLVDKNFNWLLEPKYDEMGQLDIIGYRRVTLNGKDGLMDGNNNWILEPKYENIYDLEADGSRRVFLNNKVGLVNKYGNWLLEPKYDWVGLRLSNNIKVELNGKNGLYNTKTGKITWE